jgi:hypothetical protein
MVAQKPHGGVGRGGNVQAKIEMTDGKRCLEAILGAFPEGSAHWNEAQTRA